jgi:hypothetical protein
MMAASGPTGILGAMNAAFGLRADFFFATFFGAAFFATFLAAFFGAAFFAFFAGAFFADFFAFFVAMRLSIGSFGDNSDSVLVGLLRKSALVA